MSWAVGFDTRWNRDIGYGVPAWCDHPDCWKEIDRGLSFACSNSQPYGGEGCGLYFCEEHLSGECERCRSCLHAFDAKPDHPDWIAHKANDPSWQKWREAQLA